MLWKAYEGVLLEREEGAAFITLNDPANMNPVTVTTMDYLCGALRLCEQDEEIRVIVLRGAGGNFSPAAMLRR